jgi:hypothetical protein
MSNTVEQIKEHFDAFLAEDAKFTGGNSAAGTRARKALAELTKEMKLQQRKTLAKKPKLKYNEQSRPRATGP